MSVEGVQSGEEAIERAAQHTADSDPKGYGYEHCTWCGNEWPCVTAALLEIVRAGVVAEEPEWEYGVGWRAGWSTRLMGIAHPSRAAAEADVADSNADPADNLEYFLVQRTPQRAEGWWVPVKQEGADT